MKRACSIVLALSLVILLAGCKPSAANTDNEIRIAIEAHLAHKGTLNLKAFDTVMKQVTLKGDHAQAQVEFHVKNGPGMMQLTYDLQKTGGAWTVIESNRVRRAEKFQDGWKPRNPQPSAGTPSHDTQPAVSSTVPTLTVA